MPRILCFSKKKYLNLSINHKINFKSNYGHHVVFHKSKFSNPSIKKLN